MTCESKFSQEELEFAYRQMVRERNLEQDRANKAVDWLEKAIGLRVLARTYSGGTVSPYPHRYRLCVKYNPDNGVGLERLKELNNISYAKCLDLCEQLERFSVDLTNEPGFGADDIYDGYIEEEEMHFK